MLGREMLRCVEYCNKSKEKKKKKKYIIQR